MPIGVSVKVPELVVVTGVEKLSILTIGERAFAASKLIADTKLITTEDVPVELLNFFSEYGEKARRGTVIQAEVFSAALISK